MIKLKTLITENSEEITPEKIQEAYSQFVKLFPFFKRVVKDIKITPSGYISFKGFANIETGEINIDPENIDDAIELINIISHEAHHLAYAKKHPTYVKMLQFKANTALLFHKLIRDINTLFNSPKLNGIAYYFAKIYMNIPYERRAKKFASYATSKVVGQQLMFLYDKSKEHDAIEKPEDGRDYD